MLLREVPLLQAGCRAGGPGQTAAGVAAAPMTGQAGPGRRGVNTGNQGAAAGTKTLAADVLPTRRFAATQSRSQPTC